MLALCIQRSEDEDVQISKTENRPSKRDRSTGASAFSIPEVSGSATKSESKRALDGLTVHLMSKVPWRVRVRGF
jgi:hypothetical protein